MKSKQQSDSIWKQHTIVANTIEQPRAEKSPSKYYFS